MKKIILCWMLCIWGSGELYAQTFCATPSNVPDILQQIPQRRLLQPSNNYVVRIFVHIIRRNDGTGGQSMPDVEQALSILVGDYEAQSICISLLGIDEILNTTYYDQSIFISDGNSDGKFDNFSPNAHNNAIDIYLLGEDANFVGGLAANIIATSLVIGGNLFGTNLPISHVLSHELGHCLGLYHTFHGLCEGGCAELVNGSNCLVCGDFVCDTPPDPETFSNNVDCSWNGVTCGVSNLDANGAPYNPQMNLIMAYVRPDCMQLFTNGQGDRMKTIIANSNLLQNVIVPNSLTISSLSIGPGVIRLYDVLNDLTMQTNVVVSAGGSLTLRAGQTITLTDFFNAQNSSTFHAYIDNACSTIDEDNSAKAALTHLNIVEQKPVEEFKGFNISIYPNPVSNILNMKITSQKKNVIEIKLLSSIGYVVKTVKYTIPLKGIYNFQLDATPLISGTYFIIVSDGTKKVAKKLIKL
jgi:hypothetical protein